MSRRAKVALIGAATGVALLIATWYASRFIGFVQRADDSILRGFAELHRPALDRVTRFIAGLCDPQSYVFLAAVPVLVAIIRGRPRVAVTIAVIMLGANETTQLLKPLLAEPRAVAGGFAIATGSWPSGHATAVMALTLCSVIAAPARRRPIVAAAMAAFAIAVCYSFLELEWHYPSDVLGGFLVAGTWTLLGVASLSTRAATQTAPDGRSAATGPAATGTALDGRSAATSPAPTISVGEALAPAAAILVAGLVFVALILLARPHAVVAYARAHEAFMVGAAAISVAGVSLTSGLMLVMRRG